MQEKSFMGCINLTEIIVNSNTEYKSLNPNKEKCDYPLNFFGCYNVNQEIISEIHEKIPENIEMIKRKRTDDFEIAKFDKLFGILTIIKEDIKQEDYKLIEKYKDKTKIIKFENINKISYKFDEWNEIVKIYLPESLEEIGEGVFKGCSKITDFELPFSLKSIGENAFEGCKSINRLILPNKLTSINKDTFKNCVNIEKLYLPENLKLLKKLLLKIVLKLKQFIYQIKKKP